MKVVVLFLSDGGDCTSNPNMLKDSLQKILDKFKKKIIHWWNLGFGYGAEETVLKDMS